MNKYNKATKIKLTITITLSFGLLSCSNSTDKNTIDNKLQINTFTLLDTFQIEQNELHSTEYKDFDNCDFDKFLKDPKTSKLALDIYLDKDWDLSDDNETSALLDSLTAKVKSSRPFYFKVITKSKKKSDGYYSEGLGYTGYNYVLNNTQEFAAYFDNLQCHTYNDLMTWVDIVLLEFSIIGGNSSDNSIIDDYLNKLKSNCKNSSATQKETINTFGLILKAKWSEF
jgi:hypothetical protein